MSAQATFWAQKQRPAGGTSAKIVLLILADIHNDHEGRNECRPKMATLAERCMLSERQVRRVLAGLEKEGLIARKARYSKRGGYQVANGYALALPGEKLSTPSPDIHVRPCKSSPDISDRAGKPSPDAGDRAMARTSMSALEPTPIEPAFLRAPACDAEAPRSRAVELRAAMASITKTIPSHPRRYRATAEEIEMYRRMAEGAWQ